ncbi:MAG: MFS transporter [Acidimicrobiia bacterium]|nr:MFS transporter [Acidimicrobiia bacterium]
MPDRNSALSDRGVDRRALAAVATQFFVNGALPASFIPRLPEIRDQVGISVAGVGLLISAAAVAGLAGSAVVGRTIERFGTRRVMIGAGIVISMSLGVVGLAVTPVVLLIGLTGMMAFDVLVDVPMNMQASWLSARRRVPVMNRLHGLWSLGTVVGGLSAAGIAALGVPLQTHLVGAGFVLLLVLTFVARGLLRTDETSEPVPGAEPATTRRWWNPVLVMFLLAGFFAVVLEYTSSDWAAFRLVDDFGVGAGFAGLGYIAATTGMTIGRFSGDWAVIRLGTHRLLQVAIVAAGVGLAIASLTPNRYTTLAGYLVAGLGIAMLLPRLYDDAAQFEGRPGVGLGALTAGIRIATLAAPVAVGALAATSLSVGSAIALVTLPSVLGFIVVTQGLHRRSGVFHPMPR